VHSAGTRASPGNVSGSGSTLSCTIGCSEGSLIANKINGNPISKTGAAIKTSALRQPRAAMKCSTSNGITMPPIEVPVMLTPSASARRSLNHRAATTAVGTRVEKPTPAPITRNAIIRGAKD
jgi:hypothetical protein